MFRWLLIVLLFALPAQFVSAAVSTYCGHESAPASFHPGHHAHPHRDTLDGANADVAQGQPDQPASQAHGDCSACHAHAVQLGAVESPAPGAIAQRSFADAPPRRFATRVDQDIDRPKWTRAS